MKKIHLVAIIMIGIAIFMLTTAAEDMGTYATFTEAKELDKIVNVVGQLSKDKELYYNPQEDPNYFSFFIKDADDVEKKVILRAAKPQDFELSEQIVVTGSVKGDEFHAIKMLLKCPSKYKDQEIFINTEG